MVCCVFVYCIALRVFFFFNAGCILFFLFLFFSSVFFLSLSLSLFSWCFCAFCWGCRLFECSVLMRDKWSEHVKSVLWSKISVYFWVFLVELELSVLHERNSDTLCGEIWIRSAVNSYCMGTQCLCECLPASDFHSGELPLGSELWAMIRC